jgi:hypothetical protein
MTSIATQRTHKQTLPRQQRMKTRSRYNEQTELLNSATMLYASQCCVEDKESPWTRCSLTSPEDLLKKVDFDSKKSDQ